MSLAPGVRLGAYEIVALLGAGAMGEVYRARDTRLGRDVAIKVLPDLFAADRDRVARFEREAQVLASLNHPNIAHIHGLEDVGAGKALVLELVDGPTLADLITKGPIPLAEALPIARQITEALEAAHEHGVVHRDLKPANIKLTADATVKVLDFGLAKLSSPIESSGSVRLLADLSASPTITSPAMATHAGIILGTAAYMSPEQAKGKPVDRRTDMWAFGCVLFEMLSGKRAFAGEDVSDTLAEILKAEPDWKVLPASTPALVLKLIRRCLTKDRKTRFADAAMASMEIADAIAFPAETTSARHALPGRKRGEWIAWGAAGTGLVLAGLLAAILVLQRDPPRPQPYQLSVLPPDNVRMGWAAGFGANRALASFALSPNGEYLAFLGTTEDAKTSVWLRRMDSLAAQPLPRTDGATGVFWSPDSRWIGFFADTKLKKIAVDGGTAVPLCDAFPNSTGTWNESGDILFASSARRAPIKRVSSEGGTATDVTTLTEKGTDRHGWPVFLPDGRRFLYLVAEGSGGTATLQPAGVFAAAMGSAEHKRILERGSNVAYSEGHLLFVRENVLMAQPFDAEQLELSGEARVVSDSIASAQFMTFLGTFSVSGSGLLAHQTEQREARARLLWFDRGGKPLGEVGTIADFSDPELSPDGQQIAVSVYDAAKRSRDIWIYPSKGGSGTRLTIDLANAVTPRWSSDGKEVFFSSTQKGVRDVYRKSSTGAGSEAPLIADQVEKNLADFSPDRKYALIQVTAPDTGVKLYVRPLTPDAKMGLLGFQGNQYWGRFSPDGRWLAYYSDASGRREVWVAKFPVDGSRWQVTTNGGWYPRWRRDGRELFYLGFDNTVYAVPVSGEGTAFQFGNATRLFSFNPRQPFIPYDVASDGQRFIVTNLTESPDTMPVTVLVNWTAAINTVER